MEWVFIALVVVVVAAVAMVAVGRGDGLAPAVPDRPDVELPTDRPLAAADLADLRLSVVLRGYRMDEVDALLARLGAEIADRDSHPVRDHDTRVLPDVTPPVLPDVRPPVPTDVTPPVPTDVTPPVQTHPTSITGTSVEVQDRVPRPLPVGATRPRGAHRAPDDGWESP